MKNKILFDANAMVAKNKTGVGMYTLRLIQSLSEQNHTELVGYYYNFLGRQSLDIPSIAGVTYKPIRLYPGKLVNFLRRFGIEIPVEILAKTKAPIVLYPNFVAQPTIFKAKKFAVVHDLTFIDHPEYLSDKNQSFLERFVPKTLIRSTGIITVSEDSKNKIVSHYGYDEKKILVTPIPPEDKYNISEEESKTIITNHGITKPFILFLGTLEPRKNLVTLLKAYEQRAELNITYSLVLAGGMDWKFEEIAKKIESMQKNGLNVVHCGYVDAATRAALYAQANVFILPSHYEGFGMPLLEAMQYCVPVAASDIPVFHEVAGNAALYFDQNNPIDIAAKLLEVLNNKKVRIGLIEESAAVLKKYDWAMVAKSVFDFIK